MSGPLSGVRVIEICSAISGPFAGKLLGDLGAEVIKIESPDTGAADRTRNLPYDRHGKDEFTWRFLNYNTNKESVAVDLKTEEGIELLEELLADADVLLENMRPGSMERLGYGWESLREHNPGLVYCSIKGYGADGPYTDLPALDTLIQGVSGFATQVGSDEGPGTMEILVIDMMTGLYSAWSIAAALFERHSSGQGQKIDISMLDTAVSMLGHQLAEYTAAQHHEDVEPEFGTRFVPKGFYATAEGEIALFIGDYWEAFCSAIDRPEWADPEHEYGTNDKRLERREQFSEDLESVLAARTADEWIEYFKECEETVLAAPVNRIDELADDPQIRAQNAVEKRTHPEMGEYYLPNVVPKFSRTAGSLSEAPSVGDSTDRILERLGYDADERAALREESVVE
jgi:crotonobetainyl-CoA:carnitine CoA-transferase CaiB-like acyl-CoA transferase